MGSHLVGSVQLDRWVNCLSRGRLAALLAVPAMTVYNLLLAWILLATADGPRCG